MLDSDTGHRSQFVFGYGSLAAARGGRFTRDLCARGFVADLAGFRRRWGVAMDNRRDLPGYKYYTAPAAQGGGRPAVFVAFLDVCQCAQAMVNGLCLPVDDAELHRLDRRERNYERVDVSDRVAAGGARVWAYVGSAAGRDRLAAGRRSGTAVIDASYLRDVHEAFAALGEAERAIAMRSLDPGDLPVLDLRRHDLVSCG